MRPGHAVPRGAGRREDGCLVPRSEVDRLLNLAEAGRVPFLGDRKTEQGAEGRGSPGNRPIYATDTQEAPAHAKGRAQVGRPMS